MDIKGENVEKYKLTPEQVSWSKKYKSLKLIETMLKKQIMVQQNKFKTLQEMYGQLTKRFEGLAQQLPQEATHELDGMNFKKEEPQPQPTQQPQQQGPQEEQ